MIDPLIYHDIYDIVLAIVAFVMYFGLTKYSSAGLFSRPATTNNAMLFLTIVVILFVGLRPVSWVFTDMMTYERSYEDNDLTAHNDIGIWWLGAVCHYLNLSSNIWFLIVCAIYYGSFYFATKLLCKNYSDYIFITFMVAFSTFAYATNGIRNGMGLGILILGFSMFLTGEKKYKAVACFLFVYAFFTHKSSVLPLVCFFAAYYRIGLKRSMQFWLLSVFISLIGGGAVSSIFEGLGFDDRLDNYLTATEMEGFSHVGFRWDFLLYSVMPTWLGYYALMKKGVNDRIYEILLSTYVLSNAFWVMVIRAQFSDRFAYLSWFLYPIVIAYPLFNVDIWGDRQGRMAKNILCLHLAFTLFMDLIYYNGIK